MASSILNSDDGVISGTSGIKAVGGDDGVLVFQSKGTETAQINTDSQIVAAAGTASLPVLTTTGDLNTGIYFPAADNIGFATGGTIRGRWTTDGLCFGSDTAAANALDDYEEGTWTPNLSINASTAGITYVSRSGYYVKVGNYVTLFFNITLSSKGANTGATTIGTIPFAQFTNVQYSAGMLIGEDYCASFNNPNTYIMPWNDGNLYMRYQSTAAYTDLTNNNFTNDSKFFGYVTYKVA